jgi:HEAT repeat protein
MRALHLLGPAVLGAAAIVGCSQDQPLAGGKPVAHWVEALRAPDAKVRKQAAVKLGNVGASDPAVLPALLGALEDRDAGVRCEVILALTKCGPAARDAEPTLTRMRDQDPSPRVRDFAGRALEKLQAESP